MLRSRAVAGRPPLHRPIDLVSPRHSVDFVRMPVRYRYSPDGHMFEGQPRLAEQRSASHKPTTGPGAGVVTRYRGGRHPELAKGLKCWHRIRKLLRQDQHLEVGRNCDEDLSALSRKIRQRLPRFRLGAPSKFDRIRGIERPYPLSDPYWDTQQASIIQIFRFPDPRDEDTPLLFCLGIWQADEAKYPRIPDPHSRSEAVRAKEDNGDNEQYRLFGEFQEYLLKLMEQGMGVGTALIPMKAVVMTACPGHFVTTSIDSSGKREDVLVGWLDDQKGQEDGEATGPADKWQEILQRTLHTRDAKRTTASF